MAAGGFMNLTVWQRAMELMRESYKVAATLPPSERFAMADQMRRSALSVPSNIAEGHSRIHIGEYLNHLSIASGSLAELRTLLQAAGDLGYVAPPQLARPLSLARETSRMLLALRSSLRQRGSRS
jgi:four helix bundle protein